MPKIEHIINTENEFKADCILVGKEIFTYKATGNTRKVYENKSKTFVIKIHINQNEYSTDYNKIEEELYKNSDNEIKKQLAETKILENGYIMQEYLHSLDDPDTEKWLEKKGIIMSMKDIRFAKSCRNDVGYDEQGNLKCFDIEEYKQY